MFRCGLYTAWHGGTNENADGFSGNTSRRGSALPNTSDDLEVMVAALTILGTVETFAEW
jgi:hypothetical protein